VPAKKILIVDDDQGFLLGLDALLKLAGYAVVSASDGITALSVARQESPDLILLDLGLPAGNGFLFLEWIKQLAPLATIPVIVVTAQDPSQSKDWSLKRGALAFLQKPVENKTLLAVVRRALRPSSAAAGTREG